MQPSTGSRLKSTGANPKFGLDLLGMASSGAARAGFLLCATLFSLAGAFVPAKNLPSLLHSGPATLARNCPSRRRIEARPRRGLVGISATENGMGMNDIGDLAILGALKKLRGGDVTKTRALHYPGSLNECYKFSCETASFFVKINRSFSAREMFEGEAGSLQALRFAGMNAPAPLKVGDLPHGGSYLIMDHVAFEPDLMLEPSSQAKLGEAIAQMHLHQPERHQFFGFGLPTRLGTVEMENKFCASWAEFFVESRLRTALESVGDKKCQSAILVDRAEEICEKASGMLREIDETIRPSVLHGDLWLGNAGATGEGKVIVYDPSSFYGHSEFDLAFREWPAKNGFPGLGSEFWTAYHWTQPREPGFEERHDLYKLFHLLNHAGMYGHEYVLMAEEVAERVLNA